MGPQQGMVGAYPCAFTKITSESRRKVGVMLGDRAQTRGSCGFYLKVPTKAPLKTTPSSSS